MKKKVDPEPVKLLAGGNPQIAKADGEAPVQSYINAMPEWKQDIGRRIDTLVTELVPDVEKCVRWNSPMYGRPGQGWFLSFHVYARYVKVMFFKGALLSPIVPDGKAKEARWINVEEDALDESSTTQLTNWILQAAAIPGWVP